MKIRVLLVLAVVEVVLWLVGVIAGKTLGGFLHILLLLAALATFTELGLNYYRSRYQRDSADLETPRSRRAA